MLTYGLVDKVVIYEWVWNVNRGNTDSPNDHGMIAVIDGGKYFLIYGNTVNAQPSVFRKP